MKRIIVISTLALLSLNSFAQVDTNSKPVRGQVVVEERSGDEVCYENDQLSKCAKESMLRKTYLKIKGNNNYVLEEELDLKTKKVSRVVRLESLDLNAEINKLIAAGKASVSGDTLNIDMKEVFDDENSKMTFALKGTADLRSVLCSLDTETTMDYTQKKPTEQSVNDLRSISSSRCAETLSRTELKSLDLSSVEFCDERNEDDVKCEDKQDMSFLTFDL